MIGSVLKFGMFIVLAVLGLGQLLIYRKLRKHWKKLPVVAGTVTESKLRHHSDANGRTVYEADIKFKYKFRGQEYESDTPALRGPQMFPLWEYESKLLSKYEKGEIYNVKIVASKPELAYLEIAPLSKISTVLMPIAILGYGAYLVFVGWYFSYAAEVFTK
jgi:Protein of unknown function (DUF3592)